MNNMTKKQVEVEVLRIMNAARKHQRINVVRASIQVEKAANRICNEEVFGKAGGE